MNEPDKGRPIQETLFQEPANGHSYNFQRAPVQIFLCAATSLFIFLLDFTITKTFSFSLLYVFVILMAWPISARHGVFLTATGCSVLTALGTLASPTLGENHTEIFHRLLTITLVWSLAFFLFNRKKETWSSQVALQEKTTVLEQTQAALNASLRHRQKTEHDLADLNRTLVEQNQELETIVSVASHDLRSPLVNIQGFSKELAHSRHQLQGLLESHKLVPAIKQDVMAILEGDIPESLHYIQTGAKKMESLLQGILRFSRLGRLTLHFENLNMNAMITSIIMGMEYQLKEKGISLQIEDLPNCTGDATLVNQLFFNLIDNAQKYVSSTRPGMIRIMGVQEGEYARYRVEDNGIGIRPDHQERIFQMFHRLNPSSVGGEGLGLTIVRRIVERHKGRITLNSQLDCGTTFIIDLPS
jgi:signal transduction histidine kinase